jgi:membrane-associated protease RseP (regulator of RpoE activity)
MADDEAPKSEESPATDAGGTDDTAAAGDTTPSTGDAVTDTAGTDTTVPETSAVTPPAAPTAAPAAAAPTEERRGVFVPRWVAFLVAGLVALLLVGGAGFALGRVTNDDHDHNRSAGTFPGTNRDDGGNRGGGNDGGVPFPLPGGGNGGNGSGGRQLPTVPDRGILLGVSVESVNGSTNGARVSQVVAGSPAEDAGLQAGDVITKVDDTAVTDAQELVAAIRGHSSGDEVTITYERNGQTKTVKVTLGAEASGSTSSSSSAN